jgi:hypothetical protein
MNPIPSYETIFIEPKSDYPRPIKHKKVKKEWVPPVRSTENDKELTEIEKKLQEFFNRF